MAITVKQLMKEAIDVLWEGRLWWFGFTAISFVITGMPVSFPIGLLISMWAHPTTSVGYQSAFQKLLVINIALLIAWVIILDGIITLKVLHPYRHPTSHITLQTLRHFIWRDSSYLLFACVWFSGRAIFGPHISLAILFTFTALALPFIEQIFMRLSVHDSDVALALTTNPQHNDCQPCHLDWQFLSRALYILFEFSYRCTAAPRHPAHLQPSTR